MSGWREYKEQEEKNRKKADEQGRFWRRMGSFTSIPMLFLGFGAVGYVVGGWLEKKFPSNGIILAVTILFFLGGAFREIFIMLKRL